MSEGYEVLLSYRGDRLYTHQKEYFIVVILIILITINSPWMWTRLSDVYENIVNHIQSENRKTENRKNQRYSGLKCVFSLVKLITWAYPCVCSLYDCYWVSQPGIGNKTISINFIGVLSLLLYHAPVLICRKCTSGFVTACPCFAATGSHSWVEDRMVVDKENLLVMGVERCILTSRSYGIETIKTKIVRGKVLGLRV